MRITIEGTDKEISDFLETIHEKNSLDDLKKHTEKSGSEFMLNDGINRKQFS